MERGSIQFVRNTNGTISVKIELVDGNVWMTKHEIARLFEVFVPAVTANLRVIFKNKDMFEHQVTRNIRTTNDKGETYGYDLYNIDVIIALAFRMKGGYCRLFREWLREQVKRSIVENRQQPIIIQLGNNTFLS